MQPAHADELAQTFTRQAESFNRSAVARAPRTLQAIGEFARPRPGERWLDAACGPGLAWSAGT